MSGADGVPLSLIKALGTDVFSNRTAAMLALVGRIRRNKVLPEDVSSAMKSLVVVRMDEKVFALLEQYGFFGGGVMMAGGGGGAPVATAADDDGTMDDEYVDDETEDDGGLSLVREPRRALARRRCPPPPHRPAFRPQPNPSPLVLIRGERKIFAGRDARARVDPL